MKYLFAIIYTTFIFIFSVKAQVSTKDIPLGQMCDLMLKSAVPELKLGNIDIKNLLEEDRKNPIPLAYCYYVDTLLDIKKVANKAFIENGTVWTYKIETENAKSINVYLQLFEIPADARLFVYNEKDYLGAFTKRNQKLNKSLQIADLTGNELTIEYFEPFNSEFQGQVIVGSLGLGYRDMEQVLSTDFIDINCKEGNDWQLEKHAVCKLTYRSGLKGYQCTGSLINTTANDGTPYFLTANHCISDETEAGTTVVYFNMEKSECDGTSVVAANQTVSGAQLTATSSQTDFSLLLLDEVPPLSYQPYYAGWNRDDTEPDGGVTIHHPSEMTKKIAIDNDLISSYPFVLNWAGNVQSPPNSHWEVKFDEGITISGSSGGPLFNPNGQIIGQLHGGDETSGVDYYGKISESWDINIVNAKRLKPWLDPLNTGVTEIDGYIPSGVVPDAHFSTSFNTVCINYPIKFDNYSVLNAETFEWVIDPPTVEFVNGTNSTSKNPYIQFNSSAIYTVTLKAKNNFGINQQILNNYIEAGETINTSYDISKNNFCYYEFNNIKIEPSGAETLFWITDEIDGVISSTIDSQDNIFLSLNNSIDTVYNANLKLVGTQGTCTDTADISIDVIYAFNDDIENSFPLKLGSNGPFYNNCATVQTNEPVPPVGNDCLGKDYWCDDYGNGTLIVENSTWFSFIAPESGNISIKTNGFDSQIALYEADNASDIVSGNSINYKIIEANDDKVFDNPYAQIDSVQLTPGKKYWVQLDGYQGAEGTFSIELIDNLITEAKTHIIHDCPLKLYPSPSKTGIFQIDYNTRFENEILLNIYNIEGKLLYSEIVYPKTGIIDLSKLSSGIYVIQVLHDRNVYQNKILILK